jgi:hypothetical protein
MSKFSKVCEETISLQDRSRLHSVSSETDKRGKPLREILLYISNKISGMQARYDKARISGVTRVFQTVWKTANGKLKIIHSHWK